MNITTNLPNQTNSQNDTIFFQIRSNYHSDSRSEEYKEIVSNQKKKLIINSSIFMKDKFINLLMIDGKKSIASRLLFDALFFLKRKYFKENSKKRNSVSLSNLPVGFNEEKSSILNAKTTGELGKATQSASPIDFPRNGTVDNKLKEQENQNLSVLEILSIAIENVTPSVEVRKVRRAGNTFLIPAILSQHKANTLAMRWIIESARKKQQGSSLTFAECLADEIYQAYSKQGKARQKRDELHSVATSNRANIRFRWW